MGTEWGANQLLLEIVLLNQSLACHKWGSQVSQLWSVYHQLIKSGICAPISLIPLSTSDIHPQCVMPRFSASCPPWTCGLGAVVFAGVYMVDLGGFSVVMDQPQLLYCLPVASKPGWMATFTALCHSLRRKTGSLWIFWTCVYPVFL